jgi:hypothetical protein
MNPVRNNTDTLTYFFVLGSCGCSAGSAPCIALQLAMIHGFCLIFLPIFACFLDSGCDSSRVFLSVLAGELLSVLSRFDFQQR